MAATLCNKVVFTPGWQPLSLCVRHGSKAVTRHRKPMHILKQKLLAVTEYIPPKPLAPPGALAPPARSIEEESGLVKYLKRDLHNLFKDCKMIAAVQNNATSSEEMLILKHRLHRHNIAVKFFPNQVMRSFLADSQYSNMLPLFIGQTVLFASKEPKAKEMLQVLRGSPQMVLLGACIENTLLSQKGIVQYSRLPSMTTIQGEVVGGLTILTSKTASLLHHQPARLSALLQQYLKQQEPGGATEAAAEESAPKAE